MSYKKDRTELFKKFIHQYRDRITIRGWIKLSRHNLVTFEFLELFPELSVSEMSSNPNITPDIVRQNQHLPWNFVRYSANARNTIEFVLENLDKDWCWIAISRNLKKIRQAVCMYPDLPWKWHEMGYNPNIGESFILEHKEKLTSVWLHDHISLEFVRKHPEVNWAALDFDLSMRSDVTPEMFTFPDYGLLSAYLPMDYIIGRPDLPWRYQAMSMNTSIRTSHILENPYITWDWEYMCSPDIDISLYWEHARNRFYSLPCLPISRIFDKDLTDDDISCITENPLNECKSDKEMFFKNRAAKKLYYWWIQICYDITRPVGKRMAEKNYQRYVDLCK